jgi:hypothetical protein
MSHATCMLGNWGDYWLLMISSQTTNLTPSLSFGHNLCFKCSNGSCEPILEISIAFQWYKKPFKLTGFDPWNRPLKILKSIGTPTSSFGSVKVHSLTLFALLGAWDVTPELHSWPATLEPLALVTNPKLGSRHLASTSHVNHACLMFYVWVFRASLYIGSNK